MKLNFRKYGEGPVLIILHGLYGSSDNWISVARELSEHFEVYIPDLRNHGESPHSDEHNYPSMREDLLELLQDQGIKSATLLGHSMGGKTAMFFAVEYPEFVDNLIVVDISPRSYKSEKEAPHTVDHSNIIRAMREVDFEKAENRMDIDMMLSDTIKSQRIRQFLLKNVKRKNKDRFCWKLNLDALQKSLVDILDGIDPVSVNGGTGITGFPVLFIKGQNSDYIDKPDYPLIQQLFPASEIVTIPNAGHWLHAEQPELFMKNIFYFLGI